MTVHETLNRGFNLLAVSLVSTTCFAFSAEIFFEHYWILRIDDVLLFLIGAACVWWYLRRTNRFKRSITPIIFLALALGARVFVLIIKLYETGGAANGFKGSLLLLFAAFIVIFEYFKTKRLIESFN
jgi:hypothetical protein